MKYSLKDYLLAYTGYTTIGNSNSYMFVTFAMYIIIIVSFLMFRKSNVLALGLTCVLTLLFGLFEYKMGLGSQYYNTVLTFPMGMVFSMIKPYVDKLLMKNDVLWFTGLFGSAMLFFYFSGHRFDRIMAHTLFGIFFCTTIVVLMMKINIRSSILDWFGEHIFSFFILQRIPMMIFMYFKLNRNYALFVILSFFGTVFLSILFDAAMDKLDSVLFKKRPKKELKAEAK
jgi:hypothetical protein